MSSLKELRLSMGLAGGESSCWGARGGSRAGCWWVWVALTMGVAGRRRPDRPGCWSSLRPDEGGMVWFGAAVRWTQSRRRPRHRGGGHDTNAFATRPRPGRSRGALEATDVTVAQPVVGERDDLAGDGGLGHRAVVASLGQPFASIAQPGVLAELLRCFDGRPSHQPVALFGDRPP